MKLGGVNDGSGNNEDEDSVEGDDEDGGKDSCEGQMDKWKDISNYRVTFAPEN